MWYGAGPARPTEIMRKTLALMLVVAALALPPAGPALAGSDGFTFYGGGWGHGLGLSQWGAYGLARQGWSAARILTHFYQGTRVGQAEDAPAALRIGLVQGQQRIRLEAQAGPVDLRLGGRKADDTIATVPRGETWTVRQVDGKYRIRDAAGDPVGGPVGGPNANLYAVYVPDGARVRIAETGRTYARGWIEFNLYGCPSSCAIRLIAVVPTEQYLYGLGEVPSSWPMAALKAQAIAARSYALSKVADKGQHRPVCNCALYASAYDQVYVGWDKEAGTDGERWVSAVDATAGQVVTYQGEAIQAFYMSSSGGYTENNENVWGGAPIAYLRGVCDPGDYTPANPNAVWRVSLSASEVTRRLALGIGTVTRFTGIARGVSGRILQVTVVGESGSVTVSGETLRSRLGLPDDRVWIDRNRLVVGAIRAKYDAMNCSPGLPMSRQVEVAGGLRQAFEKGTIYHSQGTGAHFLDDPVLAFYRRKGGPGGKLGFPTTDVRKMANGNLRAAFEHGRITCRPDGTCWIS
jgi:SpoIID/LytB domain protein